MEKEEELPISKKKFNKGILPQEAADLVVGEMSLDQKLQNLEVLENTPYNIGGKDGFKLEYAFNTADHLKLKTITYGFENGDYVYLAQYQAARQHYFDKDIEAFKEFVNSFKILTKQGK